MDALKIPEAETDLPSLLARAAAGETVLITRDGEALAELRPAPTADAEMDPTEKFLAGLKGIPPSPICSVELLRQMYEEDDRA